MTTGKNGSQEIETRIGTLEFTHDFAKGFPTDATIEKLYEERDFQRACQAYLWSLPVVAFASFQDGLTKGLGARNGQIVALLSYEAKRGVLTANATTPYYLGFADLSSGPLVMEMPERGVQGGISDAWQNNVPDSEAPAKYLVLGPGHKVPDNVAGYAVRQSPTFNILIGVRLTDADPEKAKQALSHLQVYPYTQRDRPPKMEIFDAGTKAWSGMPPRGMEYWERLDDVIQREPIEPRDIFFHAMLRPLGVEKGKPFEPDARQTKILTAAALVGEAMAKANTADRRFAGVKYRSDARWDFALQLDADDPVRSGTCSTNAPPGSTRPSAPGRRWRPSGPVLHRRTSALTKTRLANGWTAGRRIGFAFRPIPQSSCSGRSRSTMSTRAH